MTLAPEKSIVDDLKNTSSDSRFFAFSGTCHVQRLDPMLCDKPLNWTTLTSSWLKIGKIERVLVVRRRNFLIFRALAEKVCATIRETPLSASSCE